jgi:hypothetical protein
MDRTPRDLVIDARPRGPRGPLAGERVQGRTVLDHLLDLAASLPGVSKPVAVHARPDDHLAIASSIAARSPGSFTLAVGPPPENATILRADRLYDPSRLRRALRRGRDPESAVIWRLDRPQALDVAGEELIRRQSYQPLGRYWALEPARWLARSLAPTPVRPNAVTLASGSLMLAASVLVAFPISGVTRFAAAGMMALALVLDTADGHLARLQGTASEFGRWLDSWLDELCDMALHAAIAWSAYTRTGAPAWLLAGMSYAMGKYVFLVGTIGNTPGEAGDQGTVRAPRRSFVRGAVRLAGHADIRWHLWIALAAADRLDLALAAYAVYFPARALLGAAGKAVRHG